MQSVPVIDAVSVRRVHPVRVVETGSNVCGAPPRRRFSAEITGWALFYAWHRVIVARHYSAPCAPAPFLSARELDFREGKPTGGATWEIPPRTPERKYLNSRRLFFRSYIPSLP